MRNSKGQFQLGHSCGRPKGARNRLAAQGFEDILRHWCEPVAPGSKQCKGAEALETLYKEKPGEYLRLTASVLPREFIFENVTSDLDDDQIDELLVALRHPFAAVELLWDRDTDTVYVTKTYCLREATAVIHAAALKPWGKLPWAWPRDGRRETLEGAGKPLADQYRAQGLDMLHEHSQFEDGSVSVEAGIQDMLIRMESGRFKVFKHLT